MLLAVVCGITLAFVGKALLQQWLSGALTGRTPERTTRSAPLSPLVFPRLAPPARTRPAALPRPAHGSPYLRRAA